MGWNCIQWGGWLPGSGFIAGCSRRYRRIVRHNIAPHKAAFSLPWTNDSIKLWINVPLTHNTVYTWQFSLTLRPPYLWVGHRAFWRGVEETHCAQVGTWFVCPVAVVNDMPVDWVDPETGTNPDLWVLKLVQFLGSSLRKIMQSYELKIKYESEFLFRMRKRNRNKLPG